MSALELTRQGLTRALTAAMKPAIDAAVQRKADAVAARVRAEGGAARVIQRGPGEVVVEARRLATDGDSAFADPFAEPTSAED